MAYSAPPTFVAGNILTAAQMNLLGGDISFLANPPAAHVNRTTDQTAIVTATDTIVLWPNEDFDTDANHSTVTNTGRLTATTAGKYRASAAGYWDAVATGTRTWKLRKNGVTLLDWDEDDASTAHFVVVRLTATVQMAAADYLEVVGIHSRGVNTDLKAANGLPHFEWEWISQ